MQLEAVQTNICVVIRSTQEYGSLQEAPQGLLSQSADSTIIQIVFNAPILGRDHSVPCLPLGILQEPAKPLAGSPLSVKALLEMVKTSLSIKLRQVDLQALSYYSVLDENISRTEMQGKKTQL
uniref:Uncharacterized protein n=1 Tax=Micrurus corallinus TaxID=54390 RepID=A0A2D4FLC3_MICCO